MSRPKAATEDDRAVGARIAALRSARGLSQSVLGKSLGVSFQQVQKYETGRNRVGAGRLTTIAEVLGVPVSTLFGGESQVSLDPLGVPGASEILKAYTSIPDEGIRRDVLALVRSAARMATQRADDGNAAA